MSKTKLSRRDFLRLSAVGTAGAVLAGCAKATEAPAPQQEPAKAEPTKAPAAAAAGETKKVNIMWRVNPDEEKMLNELIPLTKEKLGFDLVTSVVPWDEFEPKLMTMYASGMAPDIYGTGGTNPYIERWVRGMVLELDNYILQEPASSTADLWPVALNAYKKKGKTVAMTFGVLAAGVWINATRFDEANVPYPSIDWTDPKAFTVEDMVAMAKKMTVDSNGDGKIDKYGLNWGHAGPWYNTRLWGKDLVSKEDYESGILHSLTASKDSAVKDAMVASMQRRADTVWVDKVGPNPDTANSLNQIGPMLKTGAIAMELTGGWDVWGDLPKEMKFRAAINPIGGENGSGTRCKNIWAEPLEINSKSKNPDEAWKFVRMMTVDKDAIKINLAHRNLTPAAKSSFDAFIQAQANHLAMSVEDQTKFYKGAIEQANTTVPDHILVGWAKVRDVLNSEFQPVGLGEKKAAEVVDGILQKVQAAIDANLKELNLT